MVDPISEPQPASGSAAEPAPPTKSGSFLSTSTGKLVVGGVAVFAVVVALGVLGFLFLANSTQNARNVAVSIRATTSTSTTLSTEAVAEPRQEQLDDTFTFRNVFAPTVQPSTVETATDSEETSSTADNSYPADTLVLISISSESGEPIAKFSWNGHTYNCHEGDVVDDSPWKVLEIHSDSVLMLYGDSRVTITIGQGLTK